MNKHIPRSRAVAQQIGAKRGRCWWNCQLAMAVCAAPDAWLQGAVYVEGFVVFQELPYLPVEHGWIEWQGEILDPTLPDQVGLYLPGLRWSYAAVVRDWPNADGGALAWLRYGFGGRRSDEYQRALMLAMRYAGMPRSVTEMVGGAVDANLVDAAYQKGWDYA